MQSPYKNKQPKRWKAITKRLVAKHPLTSKEIKEVVLYAWDEIFKSRIGTKPYFIGQDIFPKPQIIGFLLHELISLEFQKRYPGVWQIEKSAQDKDIVYLPDNSYSVEIKTSSNPKNIFGNRSYAQESVSNKKSKSGYYLAINFEKFSQTNLQPKIVKIRFGWLDQTDWIGQKAATGQQSRLNKDIETNKLIELFTLK